MGVWGGVGRKGKERDSYRSRLGACALALAFAGLGKVLGRVRTRYSLWNRYSAYDIQGIFREIYTHPAGIL